MGDWAKLAVTAGVCGLFGLFATACSSSDSGGGPPVPLDQFPQQYATAYCDSIAPCCKTAEIPYDALTCKSTATNSFTQIVEQASGPNTTYDAVAAGNCLAALKATLQSCKSLASAFQGSACQGIFKGTLPNGAMCTSSADCVSGYCSISGVSSTGSDIEVCADPSLRSVNLPPHGKAGDACGGDCLTLKSGSVSYMNCRSGTSTAAAYCFDQDGLHCSSATQTCVVLPAIGAACPDGTCATGAYCDETTLTCAAQSDSGSCENSFEACSAKSYCDQNSLRCFARKPDGYACSSDDECVNAVCSGLADTTDVSTSGICGAAPAATVDSCAGQPLF
jgi:hypothetical protein